MEQLHSLTSRTSAVCAGAAPCWGGLSFWAVGWRRPLPTRCGRTLATGSWAACPRRCAQPEGLRCAGCALRGHHAALDSCDVALGCDLGAVRLPFGSCFGRALSQLDGSRFVLRSGLVQQPCICGQRLFGGWCRVEAWQLQGVRRNTDSSRCFRPLAAWSAGPTALPAFADTSQTDRSQVPVSPFEGG